MNKLNKSVTISTKVIAVILSITMIMSLIPMAYGAIAGSSASETSPTVSVMVIGVDNSYIEVGLNIRSGENNFKAVGAVISYDPSLVEPVDWALEEPSAVTVKDFSGDTATDAREKWIEATALDTKAADNVSGKTAAAYTESGKGYVYLSAEQLKAQPLNQEFTAIQNGAAITSAGGATVRSLNPLSAAAPQTVVVRFRLVGSALIANAIGAFDIVNGDVSTASPAYDSTGVVYFEGNKGDDTPVNIEINLVASGQTVNSGGGGGGGGGGNANAYTVIWNFNDSNRATPAKRANSVVTLVRIDDDGNVDTAVPPTYTDSWPGKTITGWAADENGDSPITTPFTPTEDVTLYAIWADVAPTQADPSDFASITFYDWDGELIGSTIVSKGDASAQVADFTQSLIDVRSADYEIIGEASYLAEALTKQPSGTYTRGPPYYINNDQKPLSNHPGYSFLAWVVNDNSVRTSYGQSVMPTSLLTIQTVNLNSDDKVDFSNITGDISVKAAYTTNDEIVIGTSVADREYKIGFNSVSRYSNTGYAWQLVIRVERGDVPRMNKGILRVKMTVEGVASYSMYTLSGSDKEIIEIAPFAQAANATATAPNGTFTGVESIELSVLDQDQVRDWPNSGTARATFTTTASYQIKTVGTTADIAVWDEGSYPFRGVLGGINYTLSTSTSNTFLTLPLLRSIGIPPKAIAQARTAIRTAYNTYGSLTYKQLYEAASGLTYTGSYME